jgi:hypothetical protein
MHLDAAFIPEPASIILACIAVPLVLKIKEIYKKA